MFEIIGMAVAAWVAWNVVKAIIAILTKRTLERAVGYAASRGVPYEASEEILEQPALLKRVRKDLARASQEFAALDVYEQYGKAIMGLHAGRREHLEQAKVENVKPLRQTQFRKDELEQTRVKIKNILEPQITTLEAQGPGVGVCYITFVYVGALAMAMSKNPISFAEIKSIVEHCFEGEEHAFGIENSWAILLRSSDFPENLLAMTPIAESECRASNGDFFLKFRRKHKMNKGLSELYSGPRVDLSKVSDNWFLEV